MPLPLQFPYLPHHYAIQWGRDALQSGLQATGDQVKPVLSGFPGVAKFLRKTESYQSIGTTIGTALPIDKPYLRLIAALYGHIVKITPHSNITIAANFNGLNLKQRQFQQEKVGEAESLLPKLIDESVSWPQRLFEYV
jgi:hypothetical protein